MQFLIVINGPIASGKSTVARLLAEQLRHEGVPAEVIDLDELYPRVAGEPMDDLVLWLKARRDAAALTDSLFASDPEAVIVEGSFWDEAERRAFVDHLATAVQPQFMTLTVTYEEALRRVGLDESRTVSRDPEFLRQELEKFQTTLSSLDPSEPVMDTDRLSAGEIADEIKHSLM